MRWRKLSMALLALDLLLITMAWWAAFWFRFNLDPPNEFSNLAVRSMGWPVLAYGIGLMSSHVYRQVWRHIGLHELGQLVRGVVLGALLTAAIVLWLRLPQFPRSVLVMQPLLALVLLGAVRAAWRMASERQKQNLPKHLKPLLIIGTLDEAADALRTLKGSDQWHPLGIVSPDAGDRGQSLKAVRVLGEIKNITKIVAQTGVKTALIASPVGSALRRDVMLRSSDSGLALLTLPRADQWFNSPSASPRKVALEDLLGRSPVQLDIRGLSELFAGQTVLVTGAGGSIGSELCRQIARLGVARMVCVDVSEIAVYQLEQELRTAHPQLHVLYYTANVREADRLSAIAIAHQPNVVLHAAAYKHVPLMEDLNEIEALRTNVLGTLNAARAAGLCQAKRFVLISTDKAVNPTNIMGASKRLAELVVQAVAREFAQTQYVSVRFGNVLGSSGSVVPLFTHQIAKGGPITVTHPDIVRYFMTIPEAAQLVLQAGLMGRSGQIFVLDMGEPVKIVELARLMIRMNGKTEQEVPIHFTGLRPGEKLYEELLADDETTDHTPHPKLRIAKTGNGQSSNSSANGLLDLHALKNWIEACGALPERKELRATLRQLVPEYAAAPQ